MNSESNRIVAKLYKEETLEHYHDIQENDIWDYFMEFNPYDKSEDENKDYLNNTLLGTLVEDYMANEPKMFGLKCKVELDKELEKAYAKRALKIALDNLQDIRNVLGGQYVIGQMENMVYGYYYSNKTKVEKLYEKLDNFLNSAHDDDMKEFVVATRNTHRTLQGKLFKLIMFVVKDFAQRNYDARNEIPVLKAQEIVSKVQDITCIPLI